VPKRSALCLPQTCPDTAAAESFRQPSARSLRPQLANLDRLTFLHIVSPATLGNALEQFRLRWRHIRDE
jgi:hypothetical protein